ncbi:MAG: ornithine cyclodeaminase family protein [Acidobacteriota bacterium]
MRFISAEEVHARLDYVPLAERLRLMFEQGCRVPGRHHHQISPSGAEKGTLLLMPCWQEDHHLGVKIVSVHPHNPSLGLPSVTGLFLLMDAGTGVPLAVIDGAALTLRRTAAASALAADYLARADSRVLLMVGAGALAPHLIRAHARTRPLREVLIWNRHPHRVEQVKAQLEIPPVHIRLATNLEKAVAKADIISCATSTRNPLIQGDWVKPGTHIDLVGGFTPTMREVDDRAVERARLFVDTREGALQEAGDLIDPLSRGVISRTDIAADLSQLVRGEKKGRESRDEITLFKSVGTALEDLAAAQLLMEDAG